MHLVFENTLPNMIKHWTNKFKGFDDALQPWNLDSTVWSAIWEASKNAGSTIPAAYGPRMPNTPADAIRWTSSQISFWAQYLAPTLLRRRFKFPRYHTHFVQLIKLINLCLQYKLKLTDIQLIREGFAKWVLDYEKYFTLSV